MARVDVVALAAAAATVALSVPVPLLYVPSVTEIVAVSARYNRIAPVATPLVNVIDVAVPKFTPSTVGAMVFGAAVAPENVRFLAPAY